MKHKAVAILLLLFSILAFSSCMVRSMDHLPEGELIDTVYAPDKTRRINAFLVSGNATVDFCVRCEVEEILSGKKRNIYWAYHCQTADIEWINNTTVTINSKPLNVITDRYDWRTE